MVPALICAGVTASVCFLEWLAAQDIVTPFERIEWISYDWRLRMAARSSPQVATNLGLVAITDASIEALLAGDSLPYRFGLQWPRQVFARIVHELNTQGAKAIGFDVVFGELRPDHPPVVISNQVVSSDVYFANEIQQAGNVILAAEKTLPPPELFRTNAWATASISVQREVDGILRRTHAYSMVMIWHPVLRTAAREFGWKLSEARVTPGELILPREDGAAPDVLLLNAAQEFNVTLIAAQLNAIPAATAGSVLQPVFTRERFWQLGILLAAHELKLDLARARVDLNRGLVEIPDSQNRWLSIPVDRQGRFYIDWSITPRDPRLIKEGIEFLLEQFEARRAGRLDEVTNRWAGKLVVVGSTATGGNLADVGATPLEPETFLMSAHWNVANSVIINRFIQPLSFVWKVLLICAFGAVAGLITMKLRTLQAISVVALFGAAYVAVACWAFIQWRLWLPIVTPAGGALLVTHLCLIAYLVRHEQEERQRTRRIFSKIVSPDVVGELLDAEKLSLGGARRELTVFFADVRGFTEVTDEHQKRAEREAGERHLQGEAAESLFDREAADVLRSVNVYLGVVADCIKKHGGTLDKYIGDCVMAFWGAPVPNSRHAADCVRAVIDIQRAIGELNQQRRLENAKREIENRERSKRGEAPLPMLDVLKLGSGVNTGMMTVGLMGSDAHLVNYTVFGREVNLAARLEGASGHGRILIGSRTFHELQRDDPALAALCSEQPALMLKGFRDPVKAYEVRWLPSENTKEAAGQSPQVVRSEEERDSSCQ